MKILFLFLFDISMWLLIPKNRKKTLKMFRHGIKISRYIATLTPTKRDDEGLAWISQVFDNATQGLLPEQKKVLAKKINDDNNNFKGLGLNYDIDAKKIQVSVSPYVGAEYDMKTKKIYPSLFGMAIKM